MGYLASRHDMAPIAAADQKLLQYAPRKMATMCPERLGRVAELCRSYVDHGWMPCTDILVSPPSRREAPRGGAALPAAPAHARV